MSGYNETDLQLLVQVDTFNPSARSVLYHNYVHLNAVYLMVQVLSTGPAKFNNDEIVDMSCAALLHDVDHSLDCDVPDEENVARAMRKAEEAARVFPKLFDLRRVQSLILATEFPDPTAKLDILDARERMMAEVLIDADILSALAPLSLRNVVTGLRQEKRFAGTPLEWVKQNNQWLRDYKPRTEAGRWYHEANIDRACKAFLESLGA